METWELTNEEFNLLDDREKVIYRDASFCMGSEDAGGIFGWSRGHELLRSIGWTRQERKEGHRIFVSLHKPTPNDPVNR